MTLFKIIYWVGILAEIVIRYPFQKAREKAAKAEQHGSRTEQVLLSLLAVAGILLPLIYTFTPWLDFANYGPIPWLGWLGVLVLAGGLFLFARAHRDLSSNWSPTLEIFEGHALVTNGIYRSIRHPMYAGGWLMALAQALLLQNWLVGPAQLVVFIPFYILRVRAEEKMMLDTFGDQYRDYVKSTGSLIPKSWHS